MAGVADQQQPHDSRDSYSPAHPIQVIQRSRPAGQPETRADSNWRSIFDAALVKAQQAVQLDELGESTVAANLYAQAANDLGRVIPLCGSEKKKQSMLAIQAIYLDRVIQLKAGATGKTNQPSSSSSSNSTSVNHSQSQSQETRYSLPNGREVPYGHEDQYPTQDIYRQQDPYGHQYQQYQQYQPPTSQPPATAQQPSHTDDRDKGLRTSGKKRSKTQLSAPKPLDFVQENYSNSGSNGNGNGNGNLYGSYNSYGDYSQSGNGGYISPPHTAPTSSPSPPPVVVSPIFIAHTPSPTPPTSQTTEQPQELPPTSGKSSRWRPFGKKKSKSFSAGETAGSGPYQSPNDHEPPSVPSMPLEIQRPSFQLNNLVDPTDREDLYSQQHADWFVDQGDGPFPIEDYEHLTRYYDDDEDGDVDPYYIADTKGRARAFEGKDAGLTKASPAIVSVEDSTKKSRTKPALTHKTSSYSNEQPFAPTFSPNGYSQGTVNQADYYVQETNMFTSNDRSFQQEYGDPYYTGGQFDQQHQQQYDQQTPFDHTIQLQHSPYSVDPSLIKTGSAPELQHLNQRGTGEPEEPHDGEKAKSRNKWFSKKKKKDGPAETFDEVAKLMDEALFGGGSSIPRKKNKGKDKDREKDKDKDKDKDKGKGKADEVDMSTQFAMEEDRTSSDTPIPPNSLPMILPPKDSLSEYDIRTPYDAHGPNLDGTFMDDRLHYYGESSGSQSQQQHHQQQQLASPSIPEPFPMSSSTDALHSPTPLPLQTAQTPKALVPIAYAPRTTYTPPPKKQDTMATPTQAPSPATPELDLQLQPQNAPEAIAGNQDIMTIAPEPVKKSKNRPFNMFKVKKSGSKLSLDETLPLSPTFNQTGFSLGEDVKSVHSDKTRKSSIQSNERKAIDVVAAAHSKDSKQKRESDEYVPYEYQEELEGPLMERVEVPESREIIGFVMPVEELIDYDMEGNEEAALDNWDSWVSQLESFEKVLSDKGLKKKNSKRSKKEKKKEKELEMTAIKEDQKSISSPTSPFSSLKANRSRSSIFSTSTVGRPSTSTNSSYDANETRLIGMYENIGNIAGGNNGANRYSFASSRSSAVVLGNDLTIQQMSFQQAKKRWWNPKRKETTSLYTVSDAFSVPEQDQERYLATLLKSNQDQEDKDFQKQEQEQENPETTTPEADQGREDALNALWENSKAIMSLPIPQSPITPTSTQGFPPARGIEPFQPNPAPIPEESATATVEEESSFKPVPEPAPKPKPNKSNKPKLLPISTPLSQLLQISNPDELWQYVQQAKTYATTRMNKGDKRSAAIALKRAQALEARWQEILLEMASSDEDEDGLLDDYDDDEEEDEDEDEDEEKDGVDEQEQEKKQAAASLDAKVSITAATLSDATGIATLVPSGPTPTVPAVNSINDDEETDDDHEDDEEQARRRMLQVRKVTSRSDSAPNMYSKYKVSNKPTTTSAGDDGDSKDDNTLSKNDDGQLGPDATMEQMLATTNKDHLTYYIQRLKTDTVAKARGGSKFAALEGMKNVKVLQQRLAELEQDETEDTDKEVGE
ncbi:hypothetical protein BGZ54_009370 [Gamsiella multidivaricata]|nr:hypothetical protein BGZ54_009370 [Gamsiella multidivaricata]